MRSCRNQCKKVNICQYTYNSGYQTCSRHYPNQSSDYVLLPSICRSDRL